MFEIPSATGIDRILKIVDDSVSFLSKFIGNIFSSYPKNEERILSSACRLHSKATEHQVLIRAVV